jgi:hypothetical protein
VSQATDGGGLTQCGSNRDRITGREICQLKEKGRGG